MGSVFFRADIIGASCSCALLLFVGLIILTDKRVRGHPNNIIAFICMADSWTYFQYITRFLICGYDLNHYANWLFATTVQYPIYYVLMEKCGLSWLHLSWPEMKAAYKEQGYFYNTLALRLEAWYLGTICVIYISQFLFACTIFDLYMVMKDPFANSDKRIKTMIAIAIGLAVILASTGLFLTK